MDEQGAQADTLTASEQRRLSACNRLLEERRIIGRYLGYEICADPAWDMLLDLYVAELGRRPRSVSSLGLAAHVPPSTAIRCIKRLETDGLLKRTPDIHDARRTNVSLSSRSRAALHCLLDDIFALEPVDPQPG